MNKELMVIAAMWERKAHAHNLIVLILVDRGGDRTASQVLHDWTWLPCSTL